MLRRKVVMLVFDRVWRGEVAERRRVLMEIRGKHGCVLASVSTAIPPLDGRTRNSMAVGGDWKSL